MTEEEEAQYNLVPWEELAEMIANYSIPQEVGGGDVAEGDEGRRRRRRMLEIAGTEALSNVTFRPENCGRGCATDALLFLRLTFFCSGVFALMR